MGAALRLRYQLIMPSPSSRERAEPPVAYRDRKGGMWHASEVAQLRVVSPAIDGPNLCLVIRFEREGEERFARWIGGAEWQQSLDRLFAEAARDPDNASGMGAAPAETVALWCDLVKSMGPDELDSFERRTFAAWERESLGDLRIAIQTAADRDVCPMKITMSCRDRTPLAEANKAFAHYRW